MTSLIKSINQRFVDIYKKQYYQDRQTLFTQYLYETNILYKKNIFRRFEEDYNLDVGSEIELSIELDIEKVARIVHYTLMDCIVYRDFHGMMPDLDDLAQGQCVNFPKIMAFSTKWLLREKPVIFSFNRQKFDDLEVKASAYFLQLNTHVNEHFVLKFILLVYNSQLGREKTSSKIQKLVFPGNDIDRLRKLFKYEDFSVHYFEMYIDSVISSSSLPMLEGSELG